MLAGTHASVSVVFGEITAPPPIPATSSGNAIASTSASFSTTNPSTATAASPTTISASPVP